VYSETTHLLVSRGWSVDLCVSHEALAVLGYILVLYMVVGGKYGAVDYFIAVFFGMPAYPLFPTPLLSLKRAGETRFALSAQHVEYGCLYFLARYRSLPWLVLYFSLHTLLLHPTFLNEAKGVWSFCFKKSNTQEDETFTLVHEVEPKVVDEKTE
jgi:hypothetical protein